MVYCFIFMAYFIWVSTGNGSGLVYRRVVTKLNSEMFKLTENKFQGIAVSHYGNASELIWSELDEKGQLLIKYEVYSRLTFNFPFHLFEGKSLEMAFCIHHRLWSIACGP